MLGICCRCNDICCSRRSNPETQLDKYTDIATLGFIGGFIIMMTLDVAWLIIDTKRIPTRTININFLT